MRRRPSPLLLALVAAPFAACFADGGSLTAGKTASGSASATEGTSGADTNETSTDPSATSGTSDPTGATTTTTSPTSTSATTTSATATSTTASTTSGPTTDPTTDPSTTDMPCAGECVPGEVEVGDACESCSLEERTCTNACTWGGWVCVDHPETCAIWHLPKGAQSWEQYPLGGGTHAPKADILAAFDLEERKEAYVIAGQSYHVLSLIDRTWIRSGPISDFANLQGKQILAAYTINDGQGGNIPNGKDGITILTNNSAINYDIKLVDHSITYLESFPCCNDAWTTPESPKLTDVRAFWMDLENSEKWLKIPVGQCGNLPPSSYIDWYGAAITSTSVHTQEIGNCFEFKDKRPFGSYPPFSYPGAPTSGAQIGAAFYADGLWILQEAN